MNPPKTAMEIETATCHTDYKVVEDNQLIRLWIITGGTPALGFGMSPYDKRYPSLEKWGNDNWSLREGLPHGVRGCYTHQIGQKPIIGPNPDEVLPEGWKTFWDFYNENLPKVLLANARYAALPVKEIVSKRVRDRQNHTLVQASIHFRPYSIAPVTFSSKIYFGRCDEKIALFNPWWAKAQALLNPLSDKQQYLWSDLSESEYQNVLALLNEIKN